MATTTSPRAMAANNRKMAVTSQGSQAGKSAFKSSNICMYEITSSDNVKLLIISY